MPHRGRGEYAVRHFSPSRKVLSRIILQFIYTFACDLLYLGCDSSDVVINGMSAKTQDFESK